MRHFRAFSQMILKKCNPSNKHFRPPQNSLYIIILNLILSMIYISSASGVECQGFVEDPIQVIGLKPVSYNGKSINARVLCMAAGPCFVLINKPPLQSSKTNLRHVTKALHGLNSMGRISERFLPEFGFDDPRINCHGFACWLNRVPGVSSKTWLDSQPDPRFGLNPFLITLASYYKPVVHFSARDVGDFPRHPKIKEHDHVIFMSNGKLTHSGIVIKEKGENWTVSKMGESTVIETPLENLIVVFKVTDVLVVRKKTHSELKDDPRIADFLQEL